jgi:cell wall-associated NlpC family hydrolase
MGHKALYLFAFIGGLGAVVPAAAGDIAADALAAVGVRYRLGGETPQQGFDCSGLVFYVYREARGVTLPRSVQGLRSVGKPVRLRELRPGDLLFYNTRHRPYSHVGIYIGDGRFVHAPRPGARVRVEDFRKAYWRARFDGARRV